MIGVNKPKVYVTRRLPGPSVGMLKEQCNVLEHNGDPPTRRELTKKVRDVDAVLCVLTERMDGTLLNRAPSLKVLSTMSVGLDHIDLAEATKRGIYVTYTPGVLTETTADFAWALIMNIGRRVTEADRYVRAGKWKVPWSPDLLLGEDVHGKTLGIVGLGRIGSAVAKRARGFDMKIMYYDPERSPTRESELGVEYSTLERLLEESDYVTLHVPLTPQTRHMIGKRELQKMRRTAFIVNTSRGPIIDESALIKALKNRWVAGAALDVCESEPIAANSPLVKFENIVLAPHIASASFSTRSRMAEMAARNLITALKGETPSNLANPEVLSVRPLSEIKVL